jgi:hypothetical protein
LLFCFIAICFSCVWIASATVFISFDFFHLFLSRYWHHLNKFRLIHICMATISNVMIQCPSFCPIEEKNESIFFTS